ncbi:MAG TPA: hypothetical protein VI278_05615 [Nitrososphaeraceae archaeon]
MAVIGMLCMVAVAIASVPQAHADQGGIPNLNAGDFLYTQVLLKRSSFG